MEKPAVAEESVASLKEELTKMQDRVKQFEEMPGDVAIQIRCNREFASKYEKKIGSFLSDLLKREKVSKVQFVILEDKKNVDGKSEKVENFFFNEDAAPVQNGDDAQKLPFYDQSFEEPLGFDPDTNEDQVENQTGGCKQTCFNCLGKHHLKDCPQEHDGYRIANNKRDLMDAPTVRYHTDDAQLMEKNIRPGHISDKLRTALNLKPNQLPTYIYTMRVLGYPPGWMKEAEIEASGLTVYDSSGIGSECEEENGEKKDPASQDKKLQYDGNKFVSFPGFNTPVPDGMIDEHKELRMPPIQKHQLLSEALKHKMVSISPEYKRKKKRPDDNSSQVVEKDKNSCGEESMKTPSKNSQNQNQEHSSSKRKSAVVSGSPLIDTGNPYKKLPDSNKFAEGMSDYLPYENLPDAVGTFDKMRDVLDDVREKLSKHY